MIPANVMPEGNPAMDKHPIRLGDVRNTPSRFMLLKPEISAGLMGHVALCRLSPVLVGKCNEKYLFNIYVLEYI